MLELYIRLHSIKIFYGEIMNIIIVGCGQVGQNLAEQLIDDGNNVTSLTTVTT